MFELAERGYGTPFEQLVACIISIRTRDEESLPISARALRGAPARRKRSRAHARTQIDALIRPATFHERQGAADPRHRRARGRGVRRRAALRRRGAAVVRRRRARSARTWRSASPAASRASAWTSTSTASPTAGATCRPRPRSRRWWRWRRSCLQRYWVRDQPAAGALRQARLHRRAAEVLDLPRARHVPAGGVTSPAGNRLPLL